MSLIEIVIASAIGLVIAFAMATILTQQGRQSKQLSNIAEQNQYQNTFRQNMMNTDTYRRTFNIPVATPSP
jgi:hypothetical protein